MNFNLQVVGDRISDPIIRRTVVARKSKMSSKDGLFSYQTLVHAVAGAAVSVIVTGCKQFYLIEGYITSERHLAYERPFCCEESDDQVLHFFGYLDFVLNS